MTGRRPWADTLSNLDQAQKTSSPRVESVAGLCADSPAHLVPITHWRWSASFTALFYTTAAWLRQLPVERSLSELLTQYLTVHWPPHPSSCFTDTSDSAIENSALISKPPSLALGLLLNEWPHHLPSQPSPKPGGRLHTSFSQISRAPLVGWQAPCHFQLLNIFKSSPMATALVQALESDCTAVTPPSWFSCL